MNIVLVHGILGFQNLIELGPIGLIPYFRGVAEHFEGQGHRVLAVELNKTAGVETRAGELQDQITAGLAPGGRLDPAQQVHIIAHSMGGLDSRYMLSPQNARPNTLPVRSLTTIGTPHFGSPVADAVDDPHTPQQLKDAIGAALAKFNISLDGLRALRTDKCTVFSKAHENRKGVDYFCIAGSGRVGLIKTWSLFVPLHAFVSALTGEDNDGLVTRSSSQWGTPVGEWFADHVDEVGHNLPLLIPPGFQHIAKYDEILTHLKTLA